MKPGRPMFSSVIPRRRANNRTPADVRDGACQRRTSISATPKSAAKITSCGRQGHAHARFILKTCGAGTAAIASLTPGGRESHARAEERKNHMKQEQLTLAEARP